jgi:hypothetical protein
MLICVVACVYGVGHAESGTNVFNDPFERITTGIANCPVPQGPSFSVAEAKAESHWRAERGTSCFLSGRCRLPNSYLYDKEIAPRVKRFLGQDDRYAHSSLWIVVQRRWVFLMGCVESAEMGIAAERAIMGVDDVEAVVGHWSVDPSAVPYPVAAAPSASSGRP